MTFAKTRNPTSTWVSGSQTVLDTEIESLWTKAKSAISSRGGAYAPTILLALTGSGWLVIGPTRVIGQGILDIASTSAMVLEDEDFELLSEDHTGRVRDITTPCGVGFANQPWFGRVTRSGGMQLLAPIVAPANEIDSEPEQQTIVVPLRMHDGATLTVATLSFRVGAPHTVIPPLMPKARIVRIDLDGEKTTLSSTDAGADADGYFTVTAPGTPNAWFDEGKTKTLTLTCDQHTIVDVANYCYAIEILEEGGLEGWPWVLRLKNSVDYVATVQTTLSGASGVDGVTPANGTRVLAVGQTNKAQNGVHVVAAGAWNRSTDLLVASQFERGALFNVTKGTTHLGTLWQLQNDASIVVDTDDVLFATYATDPTDVDGSIIPRGTIWQDVVCRFELADLRWQ